MDAAILGTFEELAIHLFAEDRHNRREQLGERHQHAIERLVGGQLALARLAFPETALVAADPPVAELVINECLRLLTESGHIEPWELGTGAADQLLQVGEDPAVEV